MDWFERTVRSQACPDQTTPALMEATDDVLAKVYRDNALRVVKGLPKQ